MKWHSIKVKGAVSGMGLTKSRGGPMDEGGEAEV